MSVPNTVLPEGGRLLKRPVRKQIGGWVEMTYDAEVRYLGIRWLRVKDGMGDSGSPREDWVAELKSGCVSAHDYEWVKERQWGHHFYKSFEAALRGALERQEGFIGQKITEAEDKLKRLKADRLTIRKFLEKKS